jgi:hypothetical protein
MSADRSIRASTRTIIRRRVVRLSLDPPLGI